MSVLALATMLLRQRRRALAVALAIVVLGAPFVILGGKRGYAVDASFAPQSGRTGGFGAAAGLAAQFGIQFSPGGDAESPQFYADLLQTRRLLSGIASSEYEFATDKGRFAGTLAQFLNRKAALPAARAQEAAILWLRRSVRVDVTRAGVVTYSVFAAYPELAQQVAQRMLDAVNEYNRTTRQSSAAEQRKFVEARLAESRSELLAAEDKVQQFLQQNREFEGSPSLRFAYDRLQRDVTLKAGVVSSLAQSYEQAKIDEVRTTPVINVVETPALPVLPAARHRARSAALLLVFAALVGFVVAFTAGRFTQERERGSPHFEEFARTMKDMKYDLSHIFRRRRRTS